MGLSAREKRALAGIAGLIRAEEPDLAHSLRSFAGGAITAEVLPSRRHLFLVAMLAVVLVVLAVAVPALGNTGNASAATSHALPRA
ncbi:DUF3040 domain-containing protein [Planomonospora sp. ID82291]|uniref:DUF3040 domain-containing protein n=1 Tax=Planomonospora sp. ID82291 TaxID=2738136 RepID=UPI0018C3A5EF|nr:DUF3040 domain-containing protein [Planomonospora sp. ID82291]MBG0817327.1 DUF3040 domain-containing protein [Planomonospora sp. ID82291]